MKLAKETSNKFQVESRSAFNRILLSGLMASSFLVGCSSMGQKTDENSEPVAPPETAASTPVSSSEPKTNTERKVENADALMATLVAPIEEPVTQEPEVVIAKPVAKINVAEVKKEIKTEVTTAVKVKPIEKIVAQAPKEKMVPKKAEEVVAAKKVTKSKSILNTKPLKISVNDLPTTYDIWQFKQGVAALEKGVVISTPTWEMGKEGYNSQIWLTVMENQILINSSSDIDLSAGELGIKINGGELVPFTRIEDNNIGVLEGEWLNQLQEGGTMDIFLGFFPGKIPQSDVFKTDVSLDSLSRVVPTYRNLLK